MSGKRLLFFVGIGCFVLAGAAMALVPSTTVNVVSEADHTFGVDVRMERVRKILVRSNAVKRIVAMADARLEDQDWLSGGIVLGEKPLRNRDWHVEADGQLTVLTTNTWLGQHQIVLDQDLTIEPERLDVTSALQKPSGPIKEYLARLTLVPDENGNARFNLSLRLRIQKEESWLTRRIVESKVRDAAQSSLEEQEKAIRQVIDDHKDELIILPELGGGNANQN